MKLPWLLAKLAVEAASAAAVQRQAAVLSNERNLRVKQDDVMSNVIEFYVRYLCSTSGRRLPIKRHTTTVFPTFGSNPSVPRMAPRSTKELPRVPSWDFVFEKAGEDLKATGSQRPQQRLLLLQMLLARDSEMSQKRIP